MATVWRRASKSVSLTSFLADPRRATTSKPLASLLRAFPSQGRHTDRGGLVPVDGVNQGGGVPRFPPPLLSGVERGIIPKVSLGAAQAAIRAIKRDVLRQRASKALTVTLTPGNSLLGFAKAKALRVDWKGKILIRDTLRDVREHRSRGLLAQHATAPKSILARMIAGRLSRVVTGSIDLARSQAGRSGEQGIRPEPISAELAKGMQSGIPVSMGEPGDHSDPPVRLDPDSRAIEGNGRGEGTQRMLFLAGAVFVAWLIFRRGGVA